jgi:WD40 repeat protein
MKKVLFFCFVLLFLSQTLNAQETFFQTGHTNDILEVHFSPDDSQLVSYSGGDGRFILWDVKSGRQLWMSATSFIRKSDESTNLKEFYWSKDGKFLVTKSLNGTYQTWDANAGKILALTEQKPEIELITPDKKPISYTRDYDYISVRQAETGEIIKIERFGSNSALDTSNDATLIAEGGRWGDAAIRITEIKTGKFRWLDGHPSVVSEIVFSPDGKFFAVGGSDKIIYIFDAASKTLARKISGNTKPLDSLAFSSDGKILVSAEDNGILRVWNWQDAALLPLELKSEADILGVEKVSFSADGKYLLTSSDRTEFRLWDAKSFKHLRDFKTAEKYEYSAGMLTLGYDAVPISSVTFSRDGRRIISAHAGDGTVRIWNPDSGRQIKKLKICQNVSFASLTNDDRKILAYCDKKDEEKIKIFDAETGREIFSFDDEETGYIKTVSLSADGRHFATSDVSGDVLLWELNKAKPVRELDIGFSGDDAIAFSPDGKTFVVGGRNQNLFLFDAETGEKLWQLIASYQPGELEKKLEEESDARQAVLRKAERERDEQGEIDAEKYRKQIYITFSHYGDMSDPGEKRMLESDEPRESKIKKTRAAANAAWLRLHNDSPLPARIPTQSMYAPNTDCFFEFPAAGRMFGLCDKREISVWHGLQDKNGKWIPYGFDFGSSAVLLPKTTVLFPVPLAILKSGNQIVFSFTFQNAARDGKIGDYGKEKELRFRASDLPQPK